MEIGKCSCTDGAGRQIGCSSQVSLTNRAKKNSPAFFDSSNLRFGRLHSQLHVVAIFKGPKIGQLFS